jgi:hypothetical protein
LNEKYKYANQKFFFNLSEPELLVAISVALSTGLITPWLPAEQAKSLQIPNLNLETINSNEKANRKASATGKKTQTAVLNASANPMNKAFTIPPEATADLKKSLEVCFFFYLFFF